MAVLLDTTAMLAHYLEEPGGEEVQKILESDETVCLCSVSVAEFARRLSVLGCDAGLARSVAMQYVELCNETIAVDTAVSVRAFELGASADVRVPLVDTFIASAAQLARATLIHRDPHFASFPSVDQRELSSDDSVDGTRS